MLMKMKVVYSQKVQKFKMVVQFSFICILLLITQRHKSKAALQKYMHSEIDTEIDTEMSNFSKGNPSSSD